MSQRPVSAVVAAFLLCGSACAQTAWPSRQKSMGKWGVEHANYSGITRIGNNSYAVVSDKERHDGFYIFNIDIDLRDGKVRDVYRTALKASPQPAAGRDAEGICFLPKENTVFVSAEDDQRVLEYDIDGTPTGRALRVPGKFGTDSIFPNYGFESLTFDSVSGRIYTATERPLRGDMAADSLAVRIVGFDGSLNPCAEYLYRMEQPAMRRNVRYYAHGISEITALPDGRLVVMERELGVPRKYLGAECRVRLFVVDPRGADGGNGGAPEFLDKKAIADFTTRIGAGRLNYANYEGMCAGPRLSDGRLALVLLSDSQAGAGNSLFRLKDYVKVIVLDGV